MKFVSRNLPQIAAAMLTLVVGLSSASAFGQTRAEAGTKEKSRGFCSNNNWSSEDRVSVNDLREVTIASTGSLNVDGRQNGGVSVKGEERSDILVRACVQAWGQTEDSAKALLSAVKINTGSTIKAENTADDKNWSVSYEIRVPRATNLNLTAHNGGISISGVDGSAEFETMNGGISLNNVSGDFKGKTMNGGVNVALSGGSWKGSGLNVTTTNGGVHISMPENYAAHFETSTVNGGFSSDIPGLNVEKTDENGRRQRPTKISTDINGGGAPIRVYTTNGGVRISRPGDGEK